MNREKNLFSRDEMLQMNIETLNKRGVLLDDIADIAFKQQSKWNDDISYQDCVESVEKILSLRDVFHILQLGAEIDRLAEEIVAQGGALISEMPLGWTPRAQDFPRRNRIVAGMALGLIVVEAAKRSGSLISARLANEIGRLVFAVPGSPLDPRSEGTNQLIRQGATLITSAHDVVDEIEPLSRESDQTGDSLLETGRYEEESEPSDSDREKLLSALDRTPTSVDELVRFLDLPPSRLQVMLLELDLNGRLERHAGNQVSML